MSARPEPTSPPRASTLAPLYLAGFTTAFGAHGVATALGVEAGDLGLSLRSQGFVTAERNSLDA